MIAGAFKTALSSDLFGIGSYFTNPSIGGLYTAKTLTSTNSMVQKVLSNLFKIGIPIYPDKYEESGGNEISQQVLVGGLGTGQSEAKVTDVVAGALVKVADNIVVNPRVWKIHGYTGVNINNQLGQISQGIVNTIPSSNIFKSMIMQFGVEVVNQVFKGAIQYIAEARRPFKFNTKDGETIPCLFKSYNVTSVAENQNFVEVDLEIQEFRFIALSEGVDGEQTPVGGITGPFNMVKLGRCALKSLVF